MMPIYKSMFFWSAVIVWLLLGAGCFVFYIEIGQPNQVYDKLTAFGTITSVVGFVITLWQVAKTKIGIDNTKTSADNAKTSADSAMTSAEEAKKSANEVLSTVKEHVKRINRAFANSDVACYKQVPRDAINLLKKDNLEWACEKMTSLRECLYEIVENPEYKESEAEKIKGFEDELIVHLTTMRTSSTLPDESKKIIVDFLDKVSAYLERLSKETKYSEAKESMNG